MFAKLYLPVLLLALGPGQAGICPAQQASGEASAPAGIDYVIDLDDALNHYVDVTLTSRPTAEQTPLMMATWTPGSYLVREYARHLDRVQARDEDGNPLPIEKVSKNRWLVDTPDPDKPFSVSWRVYCNDLSVRTNHVERSYAVLNGAPTFVTLPDRMNEPHRVRLNMPDSWKRSATSLRRSGDDPDQYVAADFDELVDSPIVAGNVELFPFVVGGVEHYLVNVNDRGNWDGQRAADDLARMVETQQSVWGSVPYDRYWFLNVIGGGGGGLEHDNSCLIMSSRNAMRSDSSYLRWLSLASHEFYHTWNIRRLRPRSLVEYDYESEVYTPSLWVAEGITSYYEDLMLVRAGLMDLDQFVSSMGGQIRRLQTSEGRREQSLRESSHDAWIKFYRQSANSGDTQISYYNKGAVVAMLLDARIRTATAGAKSLDDVMRILYRDHSGPIGYQPADFRRICSEVAGTDLGEWFRLAVDSTEELDYQEMADWYGVQAGDVTPAAAETTDDSDKKKKRKPARWIGIGESGSPASQAGLSDADEILAVNGTRLSGSLNSRLQDFEAGDPVELLISRDGDIMEVLLAVGEKPVTPDWGLKLARGRTDDQAARLESLVSGQPGDPKEPEAEGAGVAGPPAEDSGSASGDSPPEGDSDSQ